MVDPTASMKNMSASGMFVISENRSTRFGDFTGAGRMKMTADDRSRT